MAAATFRFYADLNDFLPPQKRQNHFDYSFSESQSVKHLLEAVGVPHTEVAAIVVNGQPVDFSYMVQDGDRVAVYPPFISTGVSLRQLRPPLPRPARFVLDIHLGQLARYLRLLGFDTLYPDHTHDDADLAQLAHDDNRVLLTRDRGLLKRSLVTYGYCLRTRNSRQQLTAVLSRYDLFDDIQSVPRCLRCNGELRAVPKAEIMDRLQPKTQQFYHEFHVCQECDQIYWKGSHYDQIQEFIAGVRQEIVQLRSSLHSPSA